MGIIDDLRVSIDFFFNGDARLGSVMSKYAFSKKKMSKGLSVILKKCKTANCS